MLADGDDLPRPGSANRVLTWPWTRPGRPFTEHAHLVSDTHVLAGQLQEQRSKVCFQERLELAVRLRKRQPHLQFANQAQLTALGRLGRGFGRHDERLGSSQAETQTAT